MLFFFNLNINCTKICVLQNFINYFEESDANLEIRYHVNQDNSLRHITVILKFRAELFILNFRVASAESGYCLCQVAPEDNS